MKLNTVALALSLLIIGFAGGCVPTGDDSHDLELEEAVRGPHGGWLLAEGDLRLERVDADRREQIGHMANIGETEMALARVYASAMNTMTWCDGFR